uniref:T-cell surface glycoprotein CD3 epsilon chain n=1 Tax=Oryzias sinensis TaxID=183150 RepID=A0A8C7Y4I7_9TELE
MSAIFFRVMAVSVFLLVFFMFGVKAEEGGVSFWRSDVTLTCPRNGTWFQHNTQLHTGETYVLKYERPIRVHCVYEEEEATKKTFFFVKGRVCETCFELDGVYLGGAIFADVIMTAALMAFIYRRTKKVSASRSGGRASDIQSSEYQELNPRSISDGTYSAVNRRK